METNITKGEKMTFVFTDEQKDFIKLVETTPEYQELKTHRIECPGCHNHLLIPLVMTNEYVRMVSNLLGRMRTFYRKEGMYRHDVEDIIKKIKESGKSEDAEEIRRKVLGSSPLDEIFNQALKGE
jgi:hypothetical protein